MLGVGLQHLAVRRASNWFEEVAHSTHVKHKEHRVGWNGLALLCPVGFAGERGASDVSDERHASVGRERLEMDGVGHGKRLPIAVRLSVSRETWERFAGCYR